MEAQARWQLAGATVPITCGPSLTYLLELPSPPVFDPSPTPLLPSCLHTPLQSESPPWAYISPGSPPALEGPLHSLHPVLSLQTSSLSQVFLSVCAMGNQITLLPGCLSHQAFLGSILLDWNISFYSVTVLQCFNPSGKEHLSKSILTGHIITPSES